MNPIFYPLFAQVALTFIVWLCLVSYRVITLAQKRIQPQSIAEESKSLEVYKSGINLSDNFENLFEIPVLFFVAILTIVHLGYTDAVALNLAWAFVIFRALHSLVHATSNNIRIRFVMHVVSTTCVWVLWFRIAFHS